MQGQSADQVALLIDFENLVYALADQYGDQYTQELDPELLFRLAEDSGQVVLANAYADWRFKEVNQFQTDLYRLGIELIHVFGKQQKNRFKNAVDVKMAVDAVEILWTLPHVKTFVIVSGDRDFIHLLKTLRRYGRTIIGVSPEQAVSDDFAALCDRFIRYGALAHTFDGRAAPAAVTDSETDEMEPVRNALRAIVAERPAGLKGSQIKPLLRRKLSAAFDESEFGFSRLLDLLLALPETVHVVIDPNGGDVTVLPAKMTGKAPAPQAVVPGSSQLASRAGLKNYKFEADPVIRRAILTALYEAMALHEPFAWADVFEAVLERREDLPLSLSALSKYQAILWQSRLLQLEPNQHDVPTREKLMRLDPSIKNVDDLIFRYEASIAYKLSVAGNEIGMPLNAELLAEILRLAPEEEGAYCQSLIDYNA